VIPSLTICGLPSVDISVGLVASTKEGSFLSSSKLRPHFRRAYKTVVREVLVPVAMSPELRAIWRVPKRSFPPAPAEPRTELLDTMPGITRYRVIDRNSVTTSSVTPLTDGDGFERTSLMDWKGRPAMRIRMVVRFTPEANGTRV
jgi:hypothetical protein